MVLTFAATTELPLHQAILIGSVTSLVLYCVKASQSAQLVALRQGPEGWEVTPVPGAFPSGEVTVLEYAVSGSFVEVPRLDEEWPQVLGSRNAVVVLGLRGMPDVPSSKVIHILTRWAREAAAAEEWDVHRRGQPGHRQSSGPGRCHRTAGT